MVLFLKASAVLALADRVQDSVLSNKEDLEMPAVLGPAHHLVPTEVDFLQMKYDGACLRKTPH